ncbi:hypothetical protein QJS10_CPB18g00084 [Acorus calamus]|uniref:Uncharacterized protein n=1 Tax=Acorus calamus TaxID=4465 RepID=A0AAV9CNN1_ACOCL|nr:hypothetical protein QJS10_CPB18g00084 [Acorus calamus]
MASLSLVRVPLEPPNFHARPHNPTSNGRRFLHQKTNHRVSVSASVSATPPPVAVVDSAGGPSDLVRSILSKVEGTDERWTSWRVGLKSSVWTSPSSALSFLEVIDRIYQV